MLEEFLSEIRKSVCRQEAFCPQISLALFCFRRFLEAAELFDFLTLRFDLEYGIPCLSALGIADLGFSVAPSENQSRPAALQIVFKAL